MPDEINRPAGPINLEASLRAEDLDRVGRVLEYYPEAREMAQAIGLVSQRAQYPINTYRDLVDALGGEQQPVSFRGRTMILAEIRKLIPVYYFPISNEDDLIAKMADLMQKRQGSAPIVEDPLGKTVVWAQAIPMPANIPPIPQVSKEQLALLARQRASGIGEISNQ